MASGPNAAATAVKNRITPAAAPCCDLRKQLMPLELSVGYMTDMNSPESGSSQAPLVPPQNSDPRKHRKMAALKAASATVHATRPSNHAPRNRPSARSTKKIVSAYVGSQADEP